MSSQLIDKIFNSGFFKNALRYQNSMNEDHLDVFKVYVTTALFMKVLSHHYADDS